MLKASVFN